MDNLRSKKKHAAISNPYKIPYLQFKPHSIRKVRRKKTKKFKVNKLSPIETIQRTFLNISSGTVECTDNFLNSQTNNSNCPVESLFSSQLQEKCLKKIKGLEISATSTSDLSKKMKPAIIQMTTCTNVKNEVDSLLKLCTTSPSPKNNNDQQDLLSFQCFIPSTSRQLPEDSQAGVISNVTENTPLKIQQIEIPKPKNILPLKSSALKYKIHSNKFNYETNTKHSEKKPICSLFVTMNSDKNKNGSSVNFFELGATNFLVVMKPGSYIYLVGTVEIELLKGSVEILGYTLHAESKKLLVFSLLGSSHLSLKANTDDMTMQNPIYEKLVCLGLPMSMAQSLSKEAERNVLFILSRNMTHTSSVVWPKFLSSHSSFSVFPPWRLLCQETRPCNIVERKLGCLFEENLQDLGLKKFTEILDWSTIEEDVLNKEHPKIILCGGKSVGKSSYLRFLANRFLRKWKHILVLDFDLGQCEFTVPGCISATLVEEPLLGPNYCHLQDTLRSVFLGEVDVTKCPENYIEGCKSLINYAERQYNNIPWLINTMGFNKGFGVNLACGIINYSNPTHVVQIQSKDRKLNFPSKLEPKYVNCLKHQAFDAENNAIDYQLYIIPSGTEQQQNFAPKSRGCSPVESRNLVILSYMSELLNSELSSLSQVTPYKINMDNFELQTTNKYNLTKQQIAAAMNGNMVALCHKKELNSFVNCLGFGIVRAIDWQTGNMFLITPLKRSKLEKVNCLVKGNVALPDSLYYNQGEHISGHMPYLAFTSGGSTSRFAKRDFRMLPVTSRDNRKQNP